MSMTRIRSLVILASSVAVVASSSVLAATGGATILGTAFTGKPYVLAGDVVIETTGLDEVIRDFTSATEPSWVGSFAHGTQPAGIWRDLLIADGLAVALRTEYPNGFDVVDLSDPAAPVFLAGVEGNYYSSAWLCDRSVTLGQASFLVTYDLVDPAAPAFTSFLPVSPRPASRWFSAVGTTLFLIDHDSTLRILDVADPRHPVDLGTVGLAGERIDAMAAGDGALYVVSATARGARGFALDLVAYDVTEPLAPVETDRRPLGTGDDLAGLTLARAGECLLVASSDGQVRAFGLVDPAHPAVGFQLAVACDHIAVSAKWLFLASATGVAIYPRTAFDVPPGAPVTRSRVPRLSVLAGRGPIQVAQDHDHPALLAPVDASNPYLPRLGAWIDTGLSGRLSYADGLGLMAAGEGIVQLIDLEDPASPARLGQIDLAGEDLSGGAFSRKVAVYEVRVQTFELWFYDLRDPRNPVLRAKIAGHSPLAIDDRVLICRDSGLLRIYDLRDLAHPAWVGTQPVPGEITIVELHRDHAWIVAEKSNGERTIHVVGLADPAQPQLVATLPLEFPAYRLAFNEHRMYAVGHHTCRILDVADPAAPQVVAEFAPLGDITAGIAFNGDVTTVSDWFLTVRDEGFDTVDVRDTGAPLATRLATPHPNPCNPATTITFTTDRRRELTVTVHDVRGRRVAELAHGVFSPGRHTVQWCGRDERGGPVASGVYLIHLQGPGVEAAQTVTLVK